MTTRVELHQEGGVARIRFSSENGIQLMSSAACDQLSDVLKTVESDETCRVAVFEAEGRTFIAGADINELAELDADSAEALATYMHRLFRRIEELNIVTVAAIHGACAGGGFEVALACDLRMAAAGARIGLPEVALGLLPGWGGTVRVTRLFGAAVAKRLILTGELLSADEAHRLGLVDSVSPDDTFRAAVDERVELLKQRSPNACRIAKRLINSFTPGRLEEQLNAEADAFGDCFRSPESREGLAAFAEKRKPSWCE